MPIDPYLAGESERGILTREQGTSDIPEDVRGERAPSDPTITVASGRFQDMGVQAHIEPINISDGVFGRLGEHISQLPAHLPDHSMRHRVDCSATSTQLCLKVFYFFDRIHSFKRDFVIIKYIAALRKQMPPYVVWRKPVHVSFTIFEPHEWILEYIGIL